MHDVCHLETKIIQVDWAKAKKLQESAEKLVEVMEKHLQNMKEYHTKKQALIQ